MTDPASFALIVAAGVLVGAGHFLKARLGGKGAWREWREAARACELTDLRERKPFFGPAVLEGRSGKLQVRFESDSWGMRFVIEGLAAGHNLTLRRGRGAIELGDEPFDSSVLVEGRPSLVRAIFDAETRRHARQLLIVADSVAVSDGQLQMVVPRPTEVDADGNYVTLSYSALETLGATLERLLDFARRLVRHEVVARLASNARADPGNWVRLQNLLTLVREYPERPETREVLLAARDDEDQAIRLEAAISLGDEGCDILMEVASGEWGDDSAAARAVVALGVRLPRERCQAILGQALRARHVETARACLKVLGYHGNAEALEALVKVMRVEKGELASEAARALGTTGLAAQPPLVEALGSDVDQLRVAAAEALGRIGTVEAVLPLKEAEARHPDDKDLRRASRQAIAEIQSRQTGAWPGQLSLAEGGAGQLSLSDGEAGRVSLAEVDRGQLSLREGEKGQPVRSEP